jgi:hypothetical protein
MAGAWSQFLREVEAAGRALPHACPRHPSTYPLARSDWYGSSLNFEYYLRRYEPGLLVPEREAVLAVCPGCRDGAPAPGFPAGSSLVCPLCWGTGHDDRLAAQRRLAGEPPPEPPPAPPPRPPRPAGVVRFRRAGWHVAVKATASGFCAWASRTPTVADDPEGEPAGIECEYGDTRAEALARLMAAIRRP